MIKLTKEERDARAKESRKKYIMSEKGKAKRREAQKRYRQTTKGKENNKRSSYKSRKKHPLTKKEYYQRNREKIIAYETAKYHEKKRLGL